MTKQQITQNLKNLGASWAITDTKTMIEGEKVYQVHPDVSYPHQNNIIKFRSLAEIASYIKARKLTATMPVDRAVEFMQDFWVELDTARYS